VTESFIKTFKKDYVQLHDLPDAKTIMERLPLWFEDYGEDHTKNIIPITVKHEIALGNISES
jgi:hypothetical protein